MSSLLNIDVLIKCSLYTFGEAILVSLLQAVINLGTCRFYNFFFWFLNLLLLILLFHIEVIYEYFCFKITKIYFSQYTNWFYAFVGGKKMKPWMDIEWPCVLFIYFILGWKLNWVVVSTCCLEIVENLIWYLC